MLHVVILLLVLYTAQTIFALLADRKISKHKNTSKIVKIKKQTTYTVNTRKPSCR